MAATLNEMQINIRPDNITLTTIRDGVKSIKNTNLEAIQEVLTKDQRIDTPWLPGLWGVKKYTRVNDRELFVIATPPGVREMIYDFREDGQGRDGKFMSALPGFLWFIMTTVRPGSEARDYFHGYVYALKNPPLTMKDVLYQFPFSNVDDSWMCWGNNPFPKWQNTLGMVSVADHFLAMKFNNHLDHHKYEPFEVERGGKTVKLFKTSHLMEWLDEDFKKAKEEGRDPVFKYDALKRQTTVQEAIEYWTNAKLR